MFNEVQEVTRLNETQLKEITSFLKEYEFIILNETKKELKLDESVRRFLT
jgi:hypothetical protein